MTNLIGDNSNDLTPAEAKALYFHHFNQIAEQNERVKAAQAEYRNLRKRAKADGIKLSNIDFGLRCAEIDDPQIIIDELAAHEEIARFFALPVGTQTVMNFADESSTDRAAREGEAAGFAGQEASSERYAPSSKEGQAYMKGWHKGREELEANRDSALEKRNAERNGIDEGDYDPDEDEDETDDAA